MSEKIVDLIQRRFRVDARTGRIFWFCVEEWELPGLDSWRTWNERFGDTEAFLPESGVRYRRQRVTDYDGRRYLLYAHKVVWCSAHGCYPLQQVDHKDRNEQNNAFANLRLPKGNQNAANRDHPIGTTGFRGVRAYRARGGLCFRAVIGRSEEREYLGSFATAEAAARAYDRAARRRYGEYARLNFCPHDPVARRTNGIDRGDADGAPMMQDKA